MNIYEIVLTGGPCAGKTTVLTHIKELLSKDGYYVITIPEAATQLIQNGTPPLNHKKHALKFQDLILKYQITQEEVTTSYCKHTIDSNPEYFKGYKGIIIICDRGIMDNRAYLTKQEYDDMMNRHNLNELELLYSYDLVINLISLATTNPELYALDGIRYEDTETAAKRDKLTSTAWLMHPNLHMIKPTETIEEKIDLVYNHILDYINNHNIENKYPITLEESHIYTDNLTLENSQKRKKTYYQLHYPNNKKDIIVTIEDSNNNIYIINTTTQKVMTKDEFTTLLNSNLLTKIYEEHIIDFTIDGKHYRTISSNNENNTYLITQTNKILSNIKKRKKTRRI